MTIIAFRDGVVAADSMSCNENGYRTGICKKLFRHGDEVVAIMGRASESYPLMKWYSERRQEKQPDDGSIIVFAQSGITIYENGGWQPEHEAPFYAYAAGSEIALGAMAMGAFAVEAVEAAIKISIWCGGPVVSERL